ncbi:MAG: MmcQ/YjbR family DNA-binding protein [Oscillospiraceae bacterium]|nr:MmcQ/YjbR family DNA-binding protein [Oscillospiraceae bacterium]
MTKNEYLEFCGTIAAAVSDTPFEDDAESVVIRHCDTRKWFALVMKLNGKDIVNLKCEPMEADFLRSAYEGVIPAYHMNKVHWNTVFLESDVPGEEIRRMTENSFELTSKKKQRKL